MISSTKIFAEMCIYHLSKIHFIRIIILSFLLILMVSSVLFSCSDQGDDFQSYLEKNDGTEWLLSNEDLIVYIRFNNNETHLIEQWSYNKEIDCYEYNANIFSPGDFKIEENSIDKLIIQGDIILSDFENMTFTTQGNTLIVNIKFCEWQEEIVYFTRSLVKVDELSKCKLNTKGFYCSSNTRAKC